MKAKTQPNIYICTHTYILVISKGLKLCLISLINGKEEDKHGKAKNRNKEDRE